MATQQTGSPFGNTDTNRSRLSDGIFLLVGCTCVDNDRCAALRHHGLAGYNCDRRREHGRGCCRSSFWFRRTACKEFKTTFRRRNRQIFRQATVGEISIDSYKISVGRSFLLGLEVMVAADIERTIAFELTFVSLSLLAGLVRVRTFLSWTLVLKWYGSETSPRPFILSSERHIDRQRPRSHTA
jgi:hypothetical protein